ncbi:class A beta-lactamase [Thalassospira sp.]|uniref:class A beta-lactamase n=1 Tax=Thalassospira sp. TaxID=1912094 RepID=UPI000C4A9B04|nr:class A beta-lactamase [Thalassospira sp.]MBC06257.1 class A beta-lactamase [Thalassospira sp.]|tara:strand:- start:10814 stop:11695 length:882 start_codon:yes stop_codon:yes gene_type:complete
MRLCATILLRFATTIVLGLNLYGFASADTLRSELAYTVTQIENRLDARVGIVLLNTATEETWSHRPHERFLMNSTVKVPICGAILAQSDKGALSLSEALPIREADLLSYAPVTSKRVGENMIISDLCLAALDMSDNTASNLLLKRLGGPDAVTNMFRNTGDTVSRLDRFEPDLNTFVPGDPRDTTTPAAMAATLRKLFLEDALSPSSRVQLADWTSRGAVTGDLLRVHAPAGWEIFDKSGSGDKTRNIVALVKPVNEQPWIVYIFISDADADFSTRNAALKELSAAVMVEIGG